MLDMARVSDVPSPFTQSNGVNWECPSRERIVQLSLDEDKVVDVYSSMEDAYQYIVSMGRFKDGGSSTRGYLVRGMKRRDGRYVGYRWVSEWDYVAGNYEPVIKEVFPADDPIVQLFADSNEVVNVFATPHVASEMTGVSFLSIRVGVLNRTGYAAGYRWALKSRIDRGIYPSFIDANVARVQGGLKVKPLDNAVVELDRSGMVLRLMPSVDDLRSEYRLDGLAEITLKEMGVLPRGGKVLMMYSVYQERLLKKERNNPFNSRYVVEVSMDNKVLREFRTVSTLSKHLGMKQKECLGLLGKWVNGKCWMYKSDYYKS